MNELYNIAVIFTFVLSIKWAYEVYIEKKRLDDEEYCVY